MIFIFVVNVISPVRLDMFRQSLVSLLAVMTTCFTGDTRDLSLTGLVYSSSQNVVTLRCNPDQFENIPRTLLLQEPGNHECKR